jgi:hypothetical protein
MVVVVGVALLGLAAVGAFAGLRDWTLWNALRRVRPATPQRLAQAARDGRLDGRVVAVIGIAGAGPGGPLQSAVNDEPCVWHHHVVHRRHVSYRTTPRGNAQRYSRRKRVADAASREPFTLRGIVPQPARAPQESAQASRGTTSIRLTPGASPERSASPGGLAAVQVHPTGMRIDRPVARGVRILPGLVSEPFPAPEAMMGMVGQLYWHREWILRAGSPLFVLGELHTTDAGLELRRPDRGPHVVSTRTPGRLRARTAASVFGGSTLATVASAAATILLIVHFV